MSCIRPAAALLACLALTGCATSTPPPVTRSTPPTTGAPAHLTATAPAGDAVAPAPTGEGANATPTSTALDALNTLPVKGRAPKTGYDRATLFPLWLDTDGDGCEADDQAVKRVANVELRDACREVAATMTDPYTGKPLTWGASRTGIVDIDHVVALSDAWQKGAQAWDADKRARFGNDQLNLVPVAASVNRSKGDGDAATWLPPLVGYRCEYVARQVEVKRTYGLWVTQAEKDVMSGVLAACPGQVLPGPQQPATPATDAPTTGSTTDATTPPAPTPSTCAEVKAAGLGPYRKGIDPEYERFRDGDGDGLVCE